MILLFVFRQKQTKKPQRTFSFKGLGTPNTCFPGNYKFIGLIKHPAKILYADQNVFPCADTHVFRLGLCVSKFSQRATCTGR
jgi:hypothetical protein